MTSSIQITHGRWRPIALVATLAILGLSGFYNGLGQPRATPVSGGPSTDQTDLSFYDGSNRLEYVCSAASRQPPYSWSFAGGTLTSIVDATNTGTVNITGHGLVVGNPVTVTGGSDPDLNDTYYVQTVPTANSFTITTANVTDATYTTGVVVTTTAPRTSAAQWKITWRTYVTGGVATLLTSAKNQICDNRAQKTGATKVTYQ
jgi:hypothetical protein